MLIPGILALIVISALICTIVSATGHCPLWVPVFMGLFVMAVQLYGGIH